MSFEIHFQSPDVLTCCVNELCNNLDTYGMPPGIHPLAEMMFMMIWESIQPQLYSCATPTLTLE
jgi:hypothetical protein